MKLELPHHLYQELKAGIPHVAEEESDQAMNYFCTYPELIIVLFLGLLTS